jgi:hypothetical protein
MNPVRAGLIEEDQRLETYRWSSYPLYLQAPSRRPPWLRTERLFGEWSVPADSISGRRLFAAQMEARRAGERDQEYKPLRRGWFLGDKPFRKELLTQMTERRGEWHYGQELRESAEERAEGLIRAALKRKGWTEKDLQERRKGDEFKVRLAEQLRVETTVTLRWIAARLCMGTRGHLTHLLYWLKCKKPSENQSRKLKYSKTID